MLLRLLITIAMVAPFAFAQIAWPAVIELKDGSRIEGRIMSRTGTEIVVNTEGIEVKVAGDEVKTVDGLPFSCDYKALYEQKGLDIPVSDADAHFKLALWCERHNLKDEMNIEIEHVLVINPNHEGVNQKLGKLLFKGEWRTPEELKRLGFVRKDGKWMTPDEAAQAEGKVTYKGNWVRDDDRKRLDARQFSRYVDDDCGLTTHTVCDLERDITALQLLNTWNPSPQQLRQMWAVLNEAEADRQVFMQKRAEAAEEIESAWIALRNEALKGVVDSFDQDRQVEARAGAASALCKSLHKGYEFKLSTHTSKFMSILTPTQKSAFMNNYCGMCHSASKAIGGREYRGTQAGVDFLARVRSLREDDFNAQMCDLAEEVLKKFGKGPQTLLGKKAVRSGRRSSQDLSAEEKVICGIFQRARLLSDTEFERRKFNVAAELEARNQEERLRVIAGNGGQDMGALTSSDSKNTGMIVTALFDGALRRVVAAKLGIPPQQQVVQASKGSEVAVPEYKDGKSALESLCTMCHNLDRVNKAAKDPVAWRGTVEKMLRGGVWGGDMSKNINLITDYMVNRGSAGKQVQAQAK